MSPTSPTLPVLARRMTRRAIDLFVVAFVISVGLSVGSQLMDWWRAVPEPSPADLSRLSGASLDWSHIPVTLQFGDASTSIERIPYRGRRKDLEDELTKIGQSIVTSSEPSKSPPQQAERGWLSALKSAAPVFWDSDRGNVYRRFEPFPSFVATRFIDQENEPPADDQEALTQRIVAWGLAFPTTAGEWAIYVFRPEFARQPGTPNRKPVDLPDGATNVTHLLGADGSQWQVFQGRGDVPGWVKHFDDQFDGSPAVVHTIADQTASLKYRWQQTVIDIQIRQDNEGLLTGVVWSANEGKAE